MKIKQLQAKVRNLNEDILRLRQEKDTIEADRNLYRDYCIGNFKWFVKLLVDGQTPSLKYLIQEHTRLFNKVTRFYMDFGS